MTSRPAVPESETPEVDAALDELAPDQRGAVHYNGRTFIDLARSLERRLSLAQTEINGHMRIEDELKRDLVEYQAKHVVIMREADRRYDEAQARIAELEKDAARYRWLRLHAKDRNVWQPINAPEMFDAAIDAALKDRA